MKLSEAIFKTSTKELVTDLYREFIDQEIDPDHVEIIRSEKLDWVGFNDQGRLELKRRFDIETRHGDHSITWTYLISDLSHSGAVFAEITPSNYVLKQLT